MVTIRAWITACAVAASLVAGPSAAEVVSRHTDGFVLRFAVGMETTPEEVVAAVAAVPDWWDPAHTYSGDAGALSLAFEPGGCWCERLADGTTFTHARVVSIGPAQVALHAPLGPLNATATRADLTFSVAAEDREWRVALDFVVEGPGLGALADPVHGVMAGAFDRFVDHIEQGETPAP